MTTQEYMCSQSDTFDSKEDVIDFLARGRKRFKMSIILHQTRHRLTTEQYETLSKDIYKNDLGVNDLKLILKSHSTVNN